MMQRTRTIIIELPVGDTLTKEAFFYMSEAVEAAVRRHMKGETGRARMIVEEPDGSRGLKWIMPPKSRPARTK